MTDRLRVAYLLTQDHGGPVDLTVRLAATLIASGEADVRVFGPLPRRGAELVEGHHELIAVPRKGDLGAARRARAALRAWKPTVVHAQDRRAGLVSAGLPRVVHTYHGVPDDVSEPWFRGTRGAPPPSRYTRAVLTADAVVARVVARTVVPAPSMATFLTGRLRVPTHRVVHIDNCVSMGEASPAPGPVRKLLFAGLLVERKGLDLLLEALATPGTMPSDATLTVAGDGPERARAERLADRPGLRGRVRFLGFRTDVPVLLRQHDAFVLPSRMEQQPLVIAEAMAAGKPVLATDTGGVADMLTVPGAHRYLAVPGDVHDLAKQLRALFAAPAHNGDLLAASARSRFSPETCAQQHLTLYRDLAKG
ncbi:Glycosyltransferase involved in cell wall bisynthesis [Actinokineospora alba]|uniref:Glycosyltransferase involved in cell wall bisynthesis n=1 Tax=Actinokineospora alba TaxID=504798 RepID=A0A1H0HZ91_9PSEU|nr:glycosyltransferase family 4 protein [Actinokineospora alba]TDP64691.1 glycosyltransferase involved in cell wall biosynthesis [Actinokineospora alba]SDI83962.1 Glycosyltransferase involved in cell wall bisynthesis [Actinokineospora alba]SDO24180.1 Glycosyltransferase involved in cell wall bisynthesis [Actinokineospora alba]